MILDKVKVLDKPISAKGLRCINCNSLLDTKTTTTMLCNKCRRIYVSEKARQSCQNKYGVSNPMYIPGVANKIKQTMLIKYGGDCAMNSPGPRQKFENTMQERYGVKYFVNSDKYVGNSSCKSKVNAKFATFLQKHNIAFTEERVFDDKRFDFKIEGTNTKIVLEIDPSYTHSAAGSHWEPAGSTVNKQLIKTLIAEKHGYRCIHVFDWDSWDDIVNLISPKIPIYARKCSLTDLSAEDTCIFIKENGISNEIIDSDSICLGLYYMHRLVQVLVLSHDSTYGYAYELKVLCSARDVRVIGGASKLFNHAIKLADTKSVVAICDRSKFTGRVFYSLGMRLTREIAPLVKWSRGNQCLASIDRSDKQMLGSGWLPVFDAGQLLFSLGDPVENIPEIKDNVYSDYSEILRSIDKSKEKICEFCGLPFVPNSNQQRYCKRPHYMKCPVCGKDYLVTNNENLKRPPVACSYACRAKKTRETSLLKYGTAAPGNNPEAREKAKATMQERFGVDYAMQSPELKQKSYDSMMERYGVKHIAELRYASKAAHETRSNNWTAKVHELLPLKLQMNEQISPKWMLNDDKLAIFLLTERASTTFLSKYGFNIIHKFGKIHMSVGLVDDGVLYQVVRFEKIPGTQDILLADFGTREGYFNPNGYNKIMRFATQIKGIEEFTAQIPRNIASSQVIDSLSLELVSQGDYEVYWIIENKNKLLSLPVEFQKLTQRDNIEEMMKQHDYVTSDYIDTYRYVAKQHEKVDDLDRYFSYQFNNLKFN